jgi:carboxypeptidase PM20D1
MTQLRGSSADNILPSEAQAILNLRLLSPWTVDSAIAYVKGIIHDPRISVTVSPLRAANGPVGASSEVAGGKGPGWKEITSAISTVFPDAAVLPFLVTATTDSRHYAELCDAVYRFGPLVLDSQELARIHGHDERISLENVRAGIRWYTELLRTL